MWRKSLLKLLRNLLIIFTISLCLEILSSHIDWIVVFLFNRHEFYSLRTLANIGIISSGCLFFIAHLFIKNFTSLPTILLLNLAILRISWQASYISSSSSTPGIEFLINTSSIILLILCFQKLKLPNPQKEQPEELSFSCSYSLKNLMLWLFIFIPLQVILTVFIIGLRLELATNGYVFLKPDGMYSRERTFENNSKELQLTGMVHIAEPEFYKKFEQSITGENVLLLLEGVSDKQNLIKTPPNYGAISKAIGLESQKKEFKINSNQGKIKKLRADVDVASFHPETIEIINLIGKVKSNNNFNVEKFIELNIKTSSHLISYKLFQDILIKRNQNLILNIEKNLAHYQKIIVPWGAFHLPEIEQWAITRGFKLQKQSSRQVFSFKAILLGIFF